MIPEASPDSSVQRDMFGREITTHTRRFSSGNRGQRQRNREDVGEETPLLPMFDAENRRQSGGRPFLEDSDDLSVSQRSERESHTDLSSGMVTKTRFWVVITLLSLLFSLIITYLYFSIRVLHTHSYHQHQLINELKRKQHIDFDFLDRRLQKIENMTSNADVIAEMHETKLKLENDMAKEQSIVDKQLAEMERNVSTTIHHNEHYVEKKLSQVDEKLQDTTSHIKELLAASEANMTKEIRSVSNELQAEERTLQFLHANVTRQVSELGSYMNKSISAVNSLVGDAKRKIKAEVNDVYASLDQYITSTTAQFAAENDFVKYQLAGSFSVLACLICLYHVTAHVRHFERPDVQRRVLAILWMVPIYSVTSWLQLVFPSSTNILSGIRDCYEAYVIYTFFAFLIAVLANSNIEVTSSRNKINSVHNKVVKLLEMRIKDQRAEKDRQDVESSLTGSPHSHTGKVTRDNSKHSGHTIAPPCSCIRYCFSFFCGSKSKTSSEVSSSNSASSSSSCFRCFCCPSGCCSRCCSQPPASSNEIDQGTTVDNDDFESPRDVAASVLYQCTFLTLQFVLIKPFLAAMPFFFWLSGVPYEEHQYYDVETNSVDWTSPKLYVLMIANLSVSLAFYGLLSFYHTTEKDLAWCDPWPKFLCIKGVVFMTFWQYIVLQMMSGMGLVEARAASQIQNLLICIEMFMASIAHFYVFPFEEWGKNYEKEQKKIGLFRDTLALSDFVTDIGLITRTRPYESYDGFDDDEIVKKRSYSSISPKSIDESNENILKWQNSNFAGDYANAQLGPRKPSRDIDKMLQSPSLNTSTPLHDAAMDMNKRLQTRVQRMERVSSRSESDESSRYSDPPNTLFPEDSDLIPEHLDTLSPTVTPAERHRNQYSLPPLHTSMNRATPQRDEHFQNESPLHASSSLSLVEGYTPEVNQGDKSGISQSSNISSSSVDKNDQVKDDHLNFSCDTDVEGYADKFLVYTSPVRSLPADTPSAENQTPYSSITKQTTELLNEGTPPNKNMSPSIINDGPNHSQVRQNSHPKTSNTATSDTKVDSSPSASSMTTVHFDQPSPLQSSLLPTSFLEDFSTSNVDRTNTPSPQPKKYPQSAPHRLQKPESKRNSNVTLEDESDSDSVQSV